MRIDEIKQILVVGAGQMGAQIAMQAALHGYAVTLNDLSMDILEKGMKGNRVQLEKRVAKGQMTQAQMDAAIGRVRLEPDLEKAARDADFAIEAIVERLEPKRECFTKLHRFCPPHAILVSNSSTLMISQIAGATKRPAQCANMHWFYPPLVMRLVEVVKGKETSEETAQVVGELVRRIGREPVILRKELPGFLVNRILRALGREAYYLLEEGVASFADIDRAVELGLNHPMGPFKLADFSGLDIGYNARLETYEITKDPKDLPPKALEVRVKRGDLGRKSGRGFYDYSTTPPTPTPD
ncbi:MAG: 3-hydroxyacyl-CoA dehydrogenase family protein [Candidatus Rokubacteria bacterium]|nr:3-hydroxyacyl-CoA dehydrogenase family protein [Candidatus Rokubacteria bacterium]MBI2555452.1 3-hydroxyacyl-CoA dehydrogenase family protein [Candidatus Rokubacteria bacterium]